MRGGADGAVCGAAQWEKLLSTQFVPGRVALANSGPGGRLGRQTRAGQLWMSQLAVWPQTITHTAPHLGALSADDRTSVIAHVIVEGKGFIEQGGAALGFEAGDLSFRNLQQPSRVVFQTPGVFVAVRLPSSALHWHHAHSSVQPHVAPRIARGTSWLAAITQGLLPHLTPGSGTPLGHLYTGLAMPWLFAAAYHGGEADPKQNDLPNATRWQQVLAYIEAHLFEADALSPACCARAVGISERYLHKLASLRGVRLGNLVQRRRLDTARALLESAACETQSIASVAYECGFNDPAHFSRVFRQRYGLSPRQSRKRGTGCN
jgi:AraC-like DNA-binding protein